ncbi:MAG: hypothetical protein CMJ78_11225 [Planctomycetaceae bacterium]|nr:hypothetical protein [Planctomycetaceae bacterium]
MSTNEQSSMFSPKTVFKDLTAGVVVFLVALPLCLGIASASDAPLFSGLVAGIIGGLVIGAVSGSSTSVSGPAAGLTAVVAAQIAALGSFEAFLFAVFVAGILQIALGVVKAGALSSFFPSSVIKGLLAAIGVILILKQTPHLVGIDKDAMGEMSFFQPDGETTFSELLNIVDLMHYGAIAVGVTSMAVLIIWDKIKFLKESLVPGPVVVVLLGVAMNFVFLKIGSPWAIQGDHHLVEIPVTESLSEFKQAFYTPDWGAALNPRAYVAAVTIAIVASLETLLNLDAVDKLDPDKRKSPPSRELIAQGCGNMTAGLIGGLPVTSVIIRGSVNVRSGAKTKLSAIFHGVLLVASVVLLPTYFNMIPMSALAGILLVTGFKLASPALFRQMWGQGKPQFYPFFITVAAIVLTDLLIGILIGLGVALVFILWSNLKAPIRQELVTTDDGEVLHIYMAEQVSFLKRAAYDTLFEGCESGSHVALDASGTDYIDPDVLSLLSDFKDARGPAHGVTVTFTGFEEKFNLSNGS